MSCWLFEEALKNNDERSIAERRILMPRDIWGRKAAFSAFF